jgi:aarF domain-containing kinase
MLLDSGQYTMSDVANEKYLAPLRRHLEWLTAPLLHEEPFDFGDPEFFKKGIDSLKEMVEKVYPAPPMYLYLFRSFFGLRVLSYQLKCRVDIGAV